MKRLACLLLIVALFASSAQAHDPQAEAAVALAQAQLQAAKAQSHSCPCPFGQACTCANCTCPNCACQPCPGITKAVAYENGWSKLPNGWWYHDSKGCFPPSTFALVNGEWQWAQSAPVMQPMPAFQLMPAFGGACAGGG